MRVKLVKIFLVDVKFLHFNSVHSGYKMRFVSPKNIYIINFRVKRNCFILSYMCCHSFISILPAFVTKNLVVRYLNTQNMVFIMLPVLFIGQVNLVLL